MSSESAALNAASGALPRENWRLRYPALARFARSAISVSALCCILFILFATLFGPPLWGVDPIAQDFALIGDPQGPTAAHPMGTDFHGRDLLARVLLGARISISVGIMSMCINLLIGVTVGTLAAWFGGWFDLMVMRIVDALYSIPLLLIVILLQIFVKPIMEALIPADANVPLMFTPDLISIYLALGVANWLTMARLARAEVLNQAGRDYVSAARSLGAGNVRILTRHVLPNCMAPLVVAATLAIPEAIYVEAFLSFIGLGVSPPLASWGSLASDAVRSIGESPHELLFPALAISFTMLAFILFGDGLRDALDPSAKR
ncbi:MAG: oligopeptide transport system permease protein [Candidatus Sumerlaeota bacterium]|nr:oligopeptide transport system permease protein [Candidatus Sumerlaeota bacterium]